jgi:hypothetical protein
MCVQDEKVNICFNPEISPRTPSSIILPIKFMDDADSTPPKDENPSEKVKETTNSPSKL